MKLIPDNIKSWRRSLARFVISAIITFSLFSHAHSATYDVPGGTLVSESQRYADQVIRGLLNAQQRTKDVFGDFRPPRFEIHVATDEKSFVALSAAGIPDWSAAVAIPSMNRIVIKSPELTPQDKPLETLIAHEYGHLVTHAYCCSGSSDIHPPRWLDEGLAMYLSSEWTFDDFVTISTSSVFSGLMPLAELEHVQSFGSNRAHLAYAQSYLAVSYLIEYYGKGSVTELLARIGEDGDIDAALQATLGANVDVFEAELFSHIRKRYTLVGILMNSTIFWGVMALVVVLAFVLAMRRRAKRYKEWDRRERYESTDFEYGDPDNPEKIDNEDRPWES